MLAEYAALRSEITTLLTIQVQFINFSVVLGGTIATLIVNKNLSLETWAFFPLPFLIFGLLYGDAKARILRAASYVQNGLRPILIDSADDLKWESFIRNEGTLKPFLSKADNLRWAVFLVPPLPVPIIWLIGVKRNPTDPHHLGVMGLSFLVEFILLFLLVWVALTLDKYEKNLLHEKQK